MIRRMFQRRGTAAEWIAANPVLGPGEIGIEQDPGASPEVVPKFKIGNGVDTWLVLDYFDAKATPIDDAGAYFTGQTVEAALQEIGSLWATKTYLATQLAALPWKQPVRAATTVAGTLATSFENGDTIDGVTLATGDRILIKNQATGSENGIYTVNASGAPTRATDADTGAEMVNASCYVSEGTTLADTLWSCTTNAPITVGSTALVFAQLSGSGGSLATYSNALGSDATVSSTSESNVISLASLPVGTYIVIAHSTMYSTAVGMTNDFYITDGTTYWASTTQTIVNTDEHHLTLAALVVLSGVTTVNFAVDNQTATTVTYRYRSTRSTKSNATKIFAVKIG